MDCKSKLGKSSLQTRTIGGTPQFDPNYGRNTKLYLYNQFYKPYTPW
jgi:hypothetical protein